MLTFWIILALLLIIAEFMTAGFLAIFFALGALFAAGATVLTDNITIQIAVFAFFSFLSIVIGKPLLQKFFKVNKEVKPSAIDAMHGKTGIVVKTITPDEYGQVKVDGSVWTARSDTAVIVEAGCKIRVTGIDGVKLVVEQMESQK